MLQDSNSSFPGASDGKESACSAGDLGSIPGLGRSPGEGNGNSLSYSCLENPMDRETWWVTVHGLAKSWLQGVTNTESFPGGTRGKERGCQYRRPRRRGFDPWVGRIPWRRAWQPTPVFLPGKLHEQRSLLGYSP